MDSDATTLLDASTDTQNDHDDPFEIIDSRFFNDTGNRLIIVNSGDDRFLHLNVNRGRLEIATQARRAGTPPPGGRSQRGGGR